MSKLTKVLAVGFTAILLAGCITDYGGRFGEMTEGEAKLWGKEIAQLSSPPSPYDGTWAATVKYNLKGQTVPGVGKVTIYGYQNPVFGAFSRDGTVDRDGDDVQGRAGTLSGFPATPAGQYVNGAWSVDNTPGAPCEFFANIKQDLTGGASPPAALCIFGFAEEIDKDMALQDAFASLDDLLKQIWAGTLRGAFQVDLTSITLNGTPVDLGSAFGIDVQHNGFRPINMALDFTSPGGQALIQALLDNTVDGEATEIGLGFSGGMTLQLPVFMTLAFNHETLRSMLAE